MSTKCRARNNHVNAILTAQDFGYIKEWSILAPVWKIVKVSFNIETPESP